MVFQELGAAPGDGDDRALPIGERSIKRLEARELRPVVLPERQKAQTSTSKTEANAMVALLTERSFGPRLARLGLSGDRWYQPNERATLLSSAWTAP